MKTNRAFTLIEVMVVLSILAIIAILAYNFFGGVTREAKLSQAATKIYNDFRVMSDAIELYQTDNGGAWPANPDALVSAGYLKSLPTPVDASFYNGTAWPIYFYEDFDDMDGGAVADGTLYLAYLNDDLCSVFIDKYASDLGTLRTAQWDYQGNTNQYPGAVLGKGARIYAMKWATADVNTCELEWVMQYND